MDSRDISIMKETINVVRRKFVKDLRRIPASRLSPAEVGNIEAILQKACTSTMMAMLEKASTVRA